MNKFSKHGLLRSTMLGAAIAMGGIAPAMLATTAHAQDYTSGAIQGVVLDANGSPVAGASVTLRSLDRGLTRTSATDANGQYRFTRLSIGDYSVSANGEVVSDVKVRVNNSTAVNIVPAADEIVTTAQRSSVLVNDFSANQLGLVVDVAEVFDTQPIARNLASLALLAPGTVSGDSAFGNLASISGASVAENAYYINGMNITDFRNFLGAQSVPFEFYEQVETKTGGYSAEFGRSTGGVVNAVTKSGSNEFHFGANLYSEPNWGRSDGRTAEAADGAFSQNQFDERDNLDGNIWASGPIIKDKLFFFGLYNFQDFESVNNTRNVQANDRTNPDDPDGPLLAFEDGTNPGGTSLTDTGRRTTTTNDSPFYGAKFDFFLTDNHQFEYTFIRDKNDTIEFDDNITYSGSEIDTVTRIDGESVTSRGGDTHIGKYTGNLTDDLTVSVLYGDQTQNQSSGAGAADAFPVILNSGSTQPAEQGSIGQWVAFTNVRGQDTRKLFRADVDYYVDNFFGDHHFRLGYDREKLKAEDETRLSGGIYYRYEDAARCDQIVALNGASVPGNRNPGTDCVRVQNYSTQGNFDTTQSAYYLQDAWEVSDNLTLNLGIRNETFDNKDAEGNTFTKLKNQWAPRLGAIYNLPDDRSQVFGSWGRYYLPVATNTNIRLAGVENFTRVWYQFDSVNADLTPNLGANQPFFNNVLGSGELGDLSSLVNGDLNPMYSDEAIFGIRHDFESTNSFLDGWQASAAFTHRDLKSVLEDVAIDAAVLDACDERGINGCEDIWTGFHQYVLTNPGADMTVTSTTADIEATNDDGTPVLTDADGNAFTSLIDFNLSAQDLGYPKATRKYTALDLTAKKRFDWGLLDLTYTLSETRGNYEGSVKSDNGQDDAGLTQDFDQPGLVDGQKGLSPNHRAHKIKVRGYYKFTDDLTLGANYRLTSPRKYGCIGTHPTDNFAAAYGLASNFCNNLDGVVGGQSISVPRGTQFEGKWLNQLDMNLSYSPEFSFGEISFRADVFNILNLRTPTDFQEFGDTTRNYGQATQFAAPRRIRLGVSYKY